jgi:DNA-nicking Smr family endonuclease
LSRARPPQPANGLHALKSLKRAMDEATRAREHAAAEALARERAAQRERELFTHSVGAVTPLKTHGRIEWQPDPPLPLPRQRERDEQAVLQESLSDEFDVESLLDTDEALSFRRPEVGQEIVRKLRRGHWVIQAHLDLHGLRTDEARERVGAFVRETRLRGLRCVRIVHGKGNGSPGRQAVLKGKVQRWLVQRDEVMAYTQARGPEGGAGALVVLLRGQG